MSVMDSVERVERDQALALISEAREARRTLRINTTWGRAGESLCGTPPRPPMQKEINDE